MSEGRNNRLTSIAGWLRRKGAGEDEIHAALLDHPERNGLPEAECRAIARSVRRYPAGPAERKRESDDLKVHKEKIWLSSKNLEAAQGRWSARWPPALDWIRRRLPLPGEMTPEAAMAATADLAACGYWHDADIKAERPAILLPFRSLHGTPFGSVKVRFCESPGDWPDIVNKETGECAPAKKSKSYGPVSLLAAHRLKRHKPGDLLFVLAGEVDLLTAILHGLPAVAVAGEGIKKLDEEEFDAVRRFKRVVLLYDADEAGRTASRATAEAWRQRGIQAVDVQPDPAWRGKDLTDWLKGGVSIEAIREHCEKAAASAAPAVGNPSTTWPDPIPLADPPVPPFPAEVLPPVLRDYTEALAECLQVPLDLPALLGLAVAAVAAGGAFKVELREGWVEPLNLYVAVALDPANRKSSAFSAMTRPLREWERSEKERLAPAIREALARRRLLEEQIKKLDAKVSKSKDVDFDGLVRDKVRLQAEIDKTAVPSYPRRVMDDATPEALTQTLAVQGGRLGVFSSEGGIFDLLAGRYSGNVNLDAILKGHSGDPIRIDRIGRPPDEIHDPAVTIGLTIQLDVLRGLAARPEFRGRGLLGRFLYAIPKSRIGSRSVETAGVPKRLEEAYERTIRRLLDVEKPVPLEGQPGFHLLLLSGDALRIHRTFAEELEPRLGPEGDLNALQDWAGKLAGAAGRLAGLLHLTNGACEGQALNLRISGETMRAAVILGDYLVGHARSAFGLMGADPNVERARRILAWIRRKKLSAFTLRDAWQQFKSQSIPAIDGIRGALQALEDHGYIAATGAGPWAAGRGRPTSQRYIVHPRIHDSDTPDSSPKSPNNAPKANSGGFGGHSGGSQIHEDGTEPPDISP